MNDETETMLPSMHRDAPKSLGSDWRTVALEELKILQEIISEWGKTIFTIRGWILTIVGGLTVALLTDKVSPVAFRSVGVIALVTFLVAELVEAAWQRKAIRRSAIVESALRGESAYNGPQIGLTLSERVTWRQTIVDAVGEFRKPLAVSFYLGLLIAIIAMSFIPYFEARSNKQPSSTGLLLRIGNWDSRAE